MMAMSNDLVRLNVGGRLMNVKRSTLHQIEGLSAMISEVTDRDKNNNIFLDFNPKYFGIVLNYLRAKSIPQQTYVPFPKLKPEEVRPFLELAKQLGLGDELSLNVPKFKLHGEWITIPDSFSEATHTGYKKQVGYALSDIHPEGIVSWKLKVEAIQEQMFLGVLRSNTDPFDNRSYDMQGSYGWLIKVGDDVIGNAWNNGKKIYNIIADVNNGDTVEVIMNSVTAKLSLFVPPVRDYHMFLPKAPGWRLHINLFHYNDKIKIVSP